MRIQVFSTKIKTNNLFNWAAKTIKTLLPNISVNFRISNNQFTTAIDVRIFLKTRDLKFYLFPRLATQTLD